MSWLWLCRIGLHRWTRRWWGNHNPHGKFATFAFRRCLRCNRHQWKNCPLICHLFNNCMAWETYEPKHLPRPTPTYERYNE